MEPMTTSTPRTGTPTPERPTITIELPSGWGRAGAAGLMAALLGWVVPVAVAMVGFWAVADSPWLRQQNWQDAVALGSSFWALSLGSPAQLGLLSLTLIPLGWSLFQLLSLRLLLGRMRQFSANSIWAAIPGFVLPALVLSLSIPTEGIWWRATLGSLLIATVAAAWVFWRSGRRFPRWLQRIRPIGSGLALAFGYLGVMLVIGLVALTVSAGVHHEQMGQAAASVGAVGGQAVILWLAQLAYLPVAAVWALAWLLGATLVGVGGEVFSAAQPPTVAVPLPAWALVPTEAGASPWWVFLLVAICYSLFTWLHLRRRNLKLVALTVGLGAVVGAGLFAAWLALSTGGLGTGALAHLGPQVGPATVAFALTFLLPATVPPLLLHPSTIAACRRQISLWREPADHVDSTTEAEEVAEAEAEAVATETGEDQ